MIYTINLSKSLFGDDVSYYAIFLFFTFGIFTFLIILFFLFFSIFVFIKKNPSYIFIRLMLFFISLILIPQILIELKIEISFFDSIKTWGVFANELHDLSDLNYVSYILTLIGLFIYFLTQNIFNFFRIPIIKLKNFFTSNNRKEVYKNKLKKEQIINNISTNTFSKANNNEQLSNKNK